MINGNNPPEEFICPITGEIMSVPFLMTDGHTYEKAAIERWLSENPISPITREPMQMKDGRMNYALARMIENYKNGSIENRYQQCRFQSNDNNNGFGNNEIQLFINDINNNKLLIRANRFDTVLKLKEKIQEKNGVDPSEQRLVCGPKQLNFNEFTLSDYNVQNNSTIHLLLRINGGINKIIH